MTAAVALGLAAALAYGAGDFLAGLLSRRVSYILVAVIASAVSWFVMSVALAATWEGAPQAAAGLWGAASGMGSALGTLALYRGLGRGPMGVVAPLSALGAAVVPVLVGVLTGDRPAPGAWAGVALALPAIWLVSSQDAAGSGVQAAPASVAPGQRTNGIVDGLLAGMGFGLLFIALDRAGEGSGLWPVAIGQATATAVLAVVAVPGLRRAVARSARSTASRRRRGRMLPDLRSDLPDTSRRVIMAAGLVGVLGAVATTLYFLSTHAGMLAIVAVVTSLYPAITVVLAAMLLHERVRGLQSVGLALALVAVTLIVVS
jgi:drug/metabolite transporter (DMT)-like permease